MALLRTKKGLTEYQWRLIARMLSRNYSVKEAFNMLENSFPDDRQIKSLCEGLNNGEKLMSLLGNSSLEKKMKFYCEYLPLEKSIIIADDEIIKEREQRKNFIGKTAYHMFLMLASIAIAVMFSDYVLPAMIDSIGSIDDNTKMIMSFFNIFSLCRNVLSAVVIIILIGIIYIKKAHREEYLWIFLHKHNMDKTLKTFVTYRFSQKLLVLLKRGIGIIDGIHVLRFQNDDQMVKLLAYHYDETLISGKGFEESLDMAYFDSQFHSLCLLGLKGDDFMSALEDYIAMVEVKVERTVKRLSFSVQLVCYAVAAVTIILAYQVLLLPLELLEGY